MPRLALPCLLALLCLPAAAQAACSDALSAAAAEVQMGAGLSSTNLRSVRSACGDSGPASLVATLVARQACDHASQLARSLPGQDGMDGALLAADQCLSANLDDALTALEAAGSEEAQPMGEPAPSADAPDEARYAPRGQSSGRLGGDAGADGDYGGVAGLGTRGSGHGGSGYGGGRRARTKGPRAATGMAPSDATRAKLAQGADVAYSRLSLGVWFDYDSASLRSEALGTIATLAEQIRRMDSGAVLEIAGHTDSTGSWYYNADLSQDRARAVQQALILAGVSRAQLTVVGLGEDYPVAANHTTWGRAQNRRVEFRFYKTVAARPYTR